ncbi:TonB-dependent receptor [Xanthocytophaga agilis]|uniref:TonB-dependent receptor n=1 Tax=Xanthocytophaga agilis TaxID=3048010 RepID=A0AAE3UJV8_9BACT|nr:TonB-dependent receptor [Xanthocytophaga agilis]MDJ1505803.1 TonB-dependent receptor [Xanthocytophaga agilis]
MIKSLRIFWRKSFCFFLLSGLAIQAFPIQSALANHTAPQSILSDITLIHVVEWPVDIPIVDIPIVDIPIKGKVRGSDGQGLPGVTVLVKGSTTGVSTDVNGNYSIQVEGPETILVFTAVGYLKEEVTVGSQTSIDINLVEDIQTLTEAVVVGYGTQEKKDVTGAISAVKGTEIENLPSGGAQQALQGRAAGVNVIRNGGAPGNAGSIRIRGIGTVNNADPLIIIDGVPAGSMNDVNPNDIESMDILKDASSSAIYGTRAANGVVIITTKRGKTGQKLRFTLNGYSGISNRIKTIDVLDAPTLAQLKRERYTNDGLAINPIWENAAYQTQQTNWQTEILQQGTTSNVDLSMAGGGEKSSFFLSGGYYDEQGMIRKSYYTRYTFRINSDHKISDRFKIGQSLQFTNQKDNAPNTLSAQDGLLWSAIRFHPGLPVEKADGSYSTSQISSEFGDINNPVFTIDTQDKNSVRNRILGSINGEFELLPGLKAKANFALDGTITDKREFNIIVNDQIRTNSRNSLTVSNEKYYAFLQEYFLSFDKQLASHTLSLVGGYTSQTFNDVYNRSQGKDFLDESPDMRYLRAAQAITEVYGTRDYDALQSVFARGNYAFKDRYLATVTFRADGSSKFAKGKKWGYFPAFSLGWRISSEPFFQNLTSTISNLKITGGWGQLGNQAVDALQYLALITSGYRYSFGGQNTTGAAQSRIPNPNIGWETAEMTNVGLEAGFLQNRLLATVNYFIKDTKKMLLPPPSLGSNGRATIPDQNVGQLRNLGLELELVYRGKVGELSYSLSGNASFIKNELTRLFNGNFLSAQTYGRTGQEITRSYEGHPYGTFYGWKTNGLYQNQSEIDNDPSIANDNRREQELIQPGDVRFVDQNADGIIDDRDRTIIGNPQPKVNYGLNASLSYKGFDLTLFFLGVGGAQIYNADRMQGIDPTYPFNMYVETINRWHGEGTSNSIPRMSTKRDNLNYRTSDLFVENGSFLRLKNISLGYTLPKAILDLLHISQARIYVTGQNIFTITPYSGMNPELGFADGNRSQGQFAQQNVDYAQYPQARTFTIGASVSF